MKQQSCGWVCVVGLAGGMVIPGLSGCERPQAHGGPALIPEVRVEMPVEREVTEYEYFTGRAEAVESVEVRARVTGYLTEIKFVAGKEVKANDVLFKIDPRPYQAVLDQANSQVLLEEARLKLAIADNARAQEIAKTPGAISKQDVDKYAAAEGEASAAVAAAKANVESAALNVEFTDVISPVDGVVSRNLLTIGNLVNQDTTLLTTVVSQDPMYGYFDVDERTMLRIQKMIREGKLKSIREGGKFPVDYGLANEGDEYPHQGELDFVNNQVDPSTGTLQVRGVFPNPEPSPDVPRLLTPGLFLRVRLPVGPPKKALLVPQSAVVTDQGSKYLLVVNSQNIVEYRPITVGPQQPDGTQVVEPVKIIREKEGFRLAQPGEAGEDSLTPTDQVIVSGLQKAKPGATVKPKPAQGEIAADAPAGGE
jgi:membrane fusion protein, multidrug efflux system